MKKIFIVLFFCAAVFSHAQQSREDMLIFIPTPTGGTTEEQNFFHAQFEMETTAAGYTVTDTRKDADYLIELAVNDNVIYYDDGTTGPPEENDPKKILELRLVRSEGDVEIVSFEWPFTEKEEMLDYDLFLLYQAMANVPMTKLHDLVETQYWRNKWLYLRASFDYPIQFYLLKSKGLGPHGPALWKESDEDETFPISGLEINPLPAATVGLEFQFLYWMSAEFGFTLNFGDAWTNALIPAIQIELKFPIKPSIHFMIEPYAMASFPMNTSDLVVEFPTVGVGGGVQLGVKGGNMGAFFVDVNFLYNIGSVGIRNTNKDYTNPAALYYDRFVLGLGIGYKVGFFDRIKE
ncbi:MAG: hypothetical protein LBH97_06320 [Treponema sp.]|jgi:hypothetical protein|nr:hypothetical protein [Treponema sp.]